MLPPAAAKHLNAGGHDALSIYDVELAGADDEAVFAFAVKERRIIVTENFADFAAILDQRLALDEASVPLVFVRKADLPQGGALAAHLADRLMQWAAQHPNPYAAAHWT